MRPRIALVATLVILAASGAAQEYGKADRGQPGDEMIQAFLAREAERIHATFLDGVKTAQELESKRRGKVGGDGRAHGGWRGELREMLSLPEVDYSSPLHVAVTGRRVRGGVVVENLHYQSLPGLYVTANLYRPQEPLEGQRLPAVLYVCGHASRGRNGNKTAYQSHGLWFARHGYVCLMLDSLQLGEIGGTHHGTYRENRWWWHSAGYTPAGVECLNGMRGIDLLIARADVDPERIAVTGISGGGAATIWIAAADERVACAAAVSGMADLPSYVGNRVINGHCDCMFLYNSRRWPWARIAAMIAPRPLLFVNSDADPIFPMDANDRVIQRLERVWSLFGAGDRIDAVVSIGGHAYREDIRRAVYRFLNTHLKSDPREIDDSEGDLVVREGGKYHHPVPPEELRAFPTDDDLPQDRINASIDRVLAPRGRRPDLEAHGHDVWRRVIRNVVLECLPQPGRSLPEAAGELVRDGDTIWLESEKGIRYTIERVVPGMADDASALLVVVGREAEEATLDVWREESRRRGRSVWVCRPRGVGPTRWTRRNPPNYVERSHLLLGRTVDGDRVTDVVAAARYLRSTHGVRKLAVGGSGAGGIIAAYAAICDEAVVEAHLRDVPATHLDARSPQFLGVLRRADLPWVLGALAPRPLVIEGLAAAAVRTVEAAFETAEARDRLRVLPLQK